jgi:hypothetical protein
MSVIPALASAHSLKNRANDVLTPFGQNINAKNILNGMKLMF